jgi:hypothetical protein
MWVWVRKKAVKPVVDLLRVGATPEKLAWSLAMGLVVGLNPLLGSTTVMALALAGVLRLNVVASQVSNHAMYPLELLLFPVWVKLGSLLFGTPGLELTRKGLEQAAKHPWNTTRALWTWEWHALVVWAACACGIAPVAAMVFKPLLRRALVRLHDEPVVEL